MPIDLVGVVSKSFAPRCLRSSRGPRLLFSIYAAPKPMQFPGLILVQSELGPQINPADLIVGGKSIGRSAFENYAAVDDVRAIGDAKRFADVVIGDQDPNPAVAQVKYDFLDVGDGNRI